MICAPILFQGRCANDAPESRLLLCLNDDLDITNVHMSSTTRLQMSCFEKNWRHKLRRCSRKPAFLVILTLPNSVNWLVILSFDARSLLLDQIHLGAATGADVRVKLVHIPRLHIDSTRPSEAAHQALSRLQAAHGTTASFFNLIVAAPGHEVPVVNNMLLTRLELQGMLAPRS